MSLVNIAALLGGFVSLLMIGKVLISVGEIKRVVKDTHTSVGKLDEKVEEHGERILTLELLQGINPDRRHLVRRGEDQHFREARKTINGDDR